MQRSAWPVSTSLAGSGGIFWVWRNDGDGEIGGGVEVVVWRIGEEEAGVDCVRGPVEGDADRQLVWWSSCLRVRGWVVCVEFSYQGRRGLR